MKLSETSIRRPVLASMISAALVLFGVIGYTRLSVRELPDIDPPIISVSTVLPGANAQVVETAVTDVLEEELSTIQGLRTLSSSSSEQSSNITLEFTLDRPVDVAAQDVRDKVSRVRGRLPVDVLEPVIAKQQADAQPFFWLALSSANYDLMQLSDIADRLVKARVQSLPGVGSAGVYGERRYAMRVWVQPEQLAARGLTVQDVEAAITSRNVEIPAGRIESTRREFSVRSLGELKTPQEFGELVVASQGTQVVKLKDVANVETVRNLLAQQVRLSRAEPGCLRFEAYHSEADPRRFLLVERWAQKSDWETHRTAKAVQEIYVPQVLPLVDREPHVSTLIE